jgi:hypothetical protein
VCFPHPLSLPPVVKDDCMFSRLSHMRRVSNLTVALKRSVSSPPILSLSLSPPLDSIMAPNRSIKSFFSAIPAPKDSQSDQSK